MGPLHQRPWEETPMAHVRSMRVGTVIRIELNTQFVFKKYVLVEKINVFEYI